MNKYRVFIHGRNLIGHDDTDQVSKFGFYVTVFIQVKNATDAEREALLLIQQDSELQAIALNQAGDDLILEVEEIEEIESFEGATFPRTGFSLYLDDAETNVQ
jgi:hypothetical protein